jgi:hypothetical protein
MELHAESLAIAEGAGDRWAVASAHGYLGYACWLQADFERATEECALALRMFRELGDVEGIAWSLLSLGTVARYQGAREQAAALLQESRSQAERIGFREGIAWSLEQLGLLAAGRGDPAAAALLRNSLEIHHDLRDRWRTCSVLEDLAAIALAQGNPRQATRLLAGAEALRVTIGTVIAPCDSAQHAATMTGARAALGDEAFAAAWQQGLRAQIEDLQADLAPPGTAIGHRPSGQPEAGTDLPAARAGSRRKPPADAGKQDAGSTAASGMLRIRALGAATVHRGDAVVTAADWEYAKPRELLFLLATSSPMTRDQLGAALWPDLSHEQLGNALHTALRGLRRALGDPGWVVYSDGRYRFNTAGNMRATSRRSSRPSPRPAVPARRLPRCPTCNGRSRPTAVTSSPGWPRANGPRPTATSSPAASSRRCSRPAGCMPPPAVTSRPRRRSAGRSPTTR